MTDTPDFPPRLAAEIEALWQQGVRARADYYARTHPRHEQCGTSGGRAHHQRRDEPVCEPCRDAEFAYQQRRKGHA